MTPRNLAYVFAVCCAAFIIVLAMVLFGGADDAPRADGIEYPMGGVR